jgi:hypothetical protein
MSNATTNQPKPDAPPRAPREGSTMWAAIEVLRGKREPMTARKIYAEISERKLAPGLKGKTPEATLAAQLAVNAKHAATSSAPSRGNSGSSAAHSRGTEGGSDHAIGGPHRAIDDHARAGRRDLRGS